jgi:hypothetical protein
MNRYNAHSFFHENASMLPALPCRISGPTCRRTCRHTLRALTAGLLCWSLAASADEFVSFGGFSYHFERDLDLNEVNPGIGYQADYHGYPDLDLSWSVGVYKNSLRRASFYGMVDYALWHPAEGWRVGIAGGLSTGYHQSPIVPLAMPFVEWRIRKLGLEAYVIPTIKPYVDGAFVLQFKWRID